MSEVWLIYNKVGANKNKAYITWFLEETEKQGIHMKLIIREHLKIGIQQNQSILFYHDELVLPPQGAVVRTIDPLLSSHLEQMHIKVFNSAEIARICNHKGLTHQAIHQLQIPMVDTFFYRKDELPLKPPLAFPFVIKNVHGKGGSEVFFIDHNERWQQMKERLDHEVIVQATNVQLGKDIRVYVIGKQIIAAMLRESELDFRANVSLGGSATLYQLNHTEQKMVQRIISHFDFDMVGIDFLIGKNGELLFNEIEDSVGSRTLSSLTDINLLEKYTTHILNKLKEA